MSIFTRKLRSNDGFTLVELMVVVAIIGLLSAVAIPNFKKYQAKSKTSEAKLQLASVYSAETAFFSDYDNFATCLNLMGYDPSNETGQRYYAIGFGAAVASIGAAAVSNGAPSGCATGSSTTSLALAAAATDGYMMYAAGKKVGGSAFQSALPATYTLGANGDTFTAAAAGIIDAKYATSSTASIWSITDNKKLTQVNAGY